MEVIKIEGGCIYREHFKDYVYSYTKARGLNEYGDVNLSSQHRVFFYPPDDGRPPEIGDFIRIVTSVQYEANAYSEVGQFERRQGIQVTEGRLKWPACDERPNWHPDWEDN